METAWHGVEFRVQDFKAGSALSYHPGRGFSLYGRRVLNSLHNIAELGPEYLEHVVVNGTTWCLHHDIKVMLEHHVWVL